MVTTEQYLVINISSPSSSIFKKPYSSLQAIKDMQSPDSLRLVLEIAKGKCIHNPFESQTSVLASLADVTMARSPSLLLWLLQENIT